MATDTDDAQVRLERKALQKTRALVDRLEQEEAQRFRGLSRDFVLVGALLLAVLGGLLTFAALKPAPKPTADMTAAEYIEHCLAKIETTANKKYRRELDGYDGRAVLAIAIRPTGEAKVEIVKSSGESHLDASFYRLAASGAPFGKPPSQAIGNKSTVEITRAFRVERSKGDLVIEREPAKGP